MRQALVAIESAEPGNIHWSIYRGLVANGLPCMPLVLPRAGPACGSDNSHLLATVSGRDDVGMVLTVGPNDHLLPEAFDVAKHHGKPIVSIQIDDDWLSRNGLAQHVDKYGEVLTSAESAVPFYLDHGVRECRYLPFAVDPKVFYPNRTTPKNFQVLFVGSATPHRAQAIACLRAAGIHAHWYGSGTGRRIPAWSIPYHVWQAAICLNFSDQPDGVPGMKIRPFEYAACHTCVVSEHWPGDHRLFTHHEMVFVDSLDEMVQKIRWLLEDGARPVTFARAAQERMIEHTWQERLREYVERWSRLL